MKKSINLKSLLASDFRNTFLNSLWSIVKGPVTAILIPLFLTEIMQGYWYTFGSLTALSILADLGFSTIVGQFSAHEYAYLKLEKGKFTGEEDHLVRLASLLKYVFKWSCIVSLIAFPIIFGVGVSVIKTDETSVGINWFVPWILCVATSSVNFIMSIVLSFFEGCGQLGKIQNNRLIGNIITTGVIWALLSLKLNLYALSLGSLAGLIINLGLLLVIFGKPIIKLIRVKNTKAYKWNKAFLNLIWRYAISFACGYLIFQVYTPLAFYFYGPIVSGKVGITMALCQACFTLANVWITVMIPKINMSAAKKDWGRMDNLLKRNIVLSVCSMLLCMVIGTIMLLSLKGKWDIVDRFMSYPAIMILLSAWLFQIIINAIAVYGRAHKREPFMIPSILCSIFSFISTYLLIKFLPSDYMFLGFTCTNFVFVFVFYFIYHKSKNKWHDELSLEIDKEEIINKKTQIDATSNV